MPLIIRDKEPYEKSLDYQTLKQFCAQYLVKIDLVKLRLVAIRVIHSHTNNTDKHFCCYPKEDFLKSILDFK